MGRKLYVGNLPYSATESSVTEKFAGSGTVESCKLISDRDTGRSRGFGFVEMATDAEAQAAIENLDGSDYDGRPMKVKPGRSKRDPAAGIAVVSAAAEIEVVMAEAETAADLSPSRQLSRIRMSSRRKQRSVTGASANTTDP